MGKGTRSAVPGQEPLVSVVVVSAGYRDLLRKCLGSLHDQDYGAREIVVVDNGSPRGLENLMGGDFPGVRFIRLDTNQGFAGGSNRGIEGARGEYVALINDDAVAEPTWIGAMVTVAESDASVGAVASIVMDGNRPGVLDSCGVGIALDGMSRQARRGMPPPDLKGPEEVLAFSGCACLLRKKALREVGLFDEDFFAYCEDTDLSLRLQRAAWKIVVSPGAVVHHYYSMTAGRYSLRKVYWVERNHFWVAIKNFPAVLLLAVPFFTAMRFLLQAASLLVKESELKAYTRMNNGPEIIRAYFRSYQDMLKKLSLMLGRRRVNRKGCPLPAVGYTRKLLRFRLSQRKVLGLCNGRTIPRDPRVGHRERAKCA